MAKVDWKQIVGAVAPVLASTFGGPLAGVAVKTIGDKLLGKPEATEDEVAAAVSAADPQLLVKLKEIDADFSKAMLDAGIELEKVAAQDRANARQREAMVHDSWTPRVIAALVVGGFLWCIYAVFSGLVKELKDPMVAGLVGTLIGYTSSKSDMIVSYYFGSSASSKAKDDTISQIAKMD